MIEALNTFTDQTKDSYSRGSCIPREYLHMGASKCLSPMCFIAWGKFMVYIVAISRKRNSVSQFKMGDVLKNTILLIGKRYRAKFYVSLIYTFNNFRANFL